MGEVNAAVRGFVAFKNVKAKKINREQLRLIRWVPVLHWCYFNRRGLGLNLSPTDGDYAGTLVHVNPDKWAAFKPTSWVELAVGKCYSNRGVIVWVEIRWSLWFNRLVFLAKMLNNKTFEHQLLRSVWFTSEVTLPFTDVAIISVTPRGATFKCDIVYIRGLNLQDLQWSHEVLHVTNLDVQLL